MSVHELKFGIEDVVRCAGACSGCLLDDVQRSGATGHALINWPALTEFCRTALAQGEAAGRVYGEIAVNFGQGDHTALGAAGIRERVRWVHETFAGRAHAYFTFSAVVRHEALVTTLAALHEESAALGQTVAIDVVFDPTSASLASFAQKYERNLNYIFDHFDVVDLNINVGHDTLRHYTPEALLAFFIENGFRSLTINWVPTVHTAGVMALHANEIGEWLANLYSLWQQVPRAGVLVMDVSLGRLMDSLRASNFDAGEAMRMAAELMQNEFYIDHAGAVYFQQAGVGDYPLMERTGWPALGRVEDFQWAAVRPRALRFASQLRQVDARCAACAFQAGCLRSGFLAVAKLLNAEGECPSGALPLWRALADRRNAPGSASRNLGRRTSAAPIRLRREGAQ